jgi:hypothetical protein
MKISYFTFGLLLMALSLCLNCVIAINLKSQENTSFLQLSESNGQYLTDDLTVDDKYDTTGNSAGSTDIFAKDDMQQLKDAIIKEEKDYASMANFDQK